MAAPMEDEDFISPRTEMDFLRERLALMSAAALMAYGALRVLNTNGQANDLIEVLEKTLFPPPPTEKE